MTISDDPERPQPLVVVSGGQGSQVGSGNQQVNQHIQTYIDQRPLTSRAEPGSVVVGEIPRRPPAFESRQDLMDALGDSGPGVTVVRALTGMRGVGKTQLAAAYARDCVDAGWPLVAWISAGTTSQLLGGLAQVAAALGLGEPGTDREALAAGVRHYLETSGERCLVVFDNVTVLDAIDRFLPAAGPAQVIITSNQAEAGGYGTPVTVDVFTKDEALSFLARRTGRDDPDGAADLAAELGNLPLALAQAAAVIAAQHLSYQAYLTRLRAVPVHRYLKRRAPDPYPHGTAEAILLTLEGATAADETGLCQGLISLLSLLSEAGVPRALLYAAAEAGLLNQPETTSSASSDQVDEAAGHLASASLLTFSVDDAVVSAHRLTMRVARERLVGQDSLTGLGAATVGLLAAVTRSLVQPWQNRTAARDAITQITACTSTSLPS